MTDLTRVTYLGPPASFSHQAALNSFGHSVSLFPSVSFAEAFSAVQNGTADFAVIPFENSTNGSVVQTLDLLADRQQLHKDITVCGEYFLTVHHCLVGARPVSEGNYTSIKKLYTHPQAWGQCEVFLSRHFRGIERQDVSSTSKAVEIIAKDTSGESAAIASKLAAEYHGAYILEENIEDRADNTTRFFILRSIHSKSAAEISNHAINPVTKESNAKKTLISFMIEHSSPGSLANALSVFKTHGLNLTSINSRPSLLRPWQYVFFIECEHGPAVNGPDAINDVLAELGGICTSHRNLGTWVDGLSSPSSLGT